jgi:hypothetical protein
VLCEHVAVGGRFNQQSELLSISWKENKKLQSCGVSAH